MQRREINRLPHTRVAPGSPVELRASLLRTAPLTHPPSWAGGSPPLGTWCRACEGTRWWNRAASATRLAVPQCFTCHPPVHLAAREIRREGEG
jgi:hypothetical protein